MPLEINIPRILIAGTQAGVGVSTVTLALLEELKHCGVSVASSKLGPGILDTLLHKRVGGRYSHMLDSWLLTREETLDAIYRLSSGAELIVIEGGRGLFDSYASDFSIQRDSDFALLTKTPVILVIDTRRRRDGVAALIHGFTTFHPMLKVYGIIANHIEDDAHDEVVRGAVNSLGGPVYLGGIRHHQNLVLSGLIPMAEDTNPALVPMSFLVTGAEQVRKFIDMKALLGIASKFQPVPVSTTHSSGGGRLCPIAVADDPAFGLTIWDNLDLLRREGAHLMPFSPLIDSRLPSKTKAVYLPGGYLHLYAKDLNANKGMRKALYDFAQKGGVIYAEGSSVAYLCSEMNTTSGTSYEMCGIIQGSATIDRVDHFQDPPEYGIASLVARPGSSSLLGFPGAKIRGLRNVKIKLKLLQQNEPALNIESRRGVSHTNTETTQLPPTTDGVQPLPNIFSTTYHLHWGSLASAARHFVMTAMGEAPNPPGNSSNGDVEVSADDSLSSNTAPLVDSSNPNNTEASGGDQATLIRQRIDRAHYSHQTLDPLDPEDDDTKLS